jgi:glycosyltransferase involved in cell wall biosynthesis
MSSPTIAVPHVRPPWTSPAGLRPWVVMLSGSPWSVAAHRQHALARELARQVRLLFVDPPSNRRRTGFSVDQVGPSLWHATVPTPVPGGRQLPLANRAGRSRSARLLGDWLDGHPGPRVLWVDEDLAAPLIGQFDEVAVIYDATDLDWTFTRRWNRWHLRRELRAAVGAADLVLASSAALPPRLPCSRRPPVVLANACDVEHFQPEGPVADWLDALPHPRLGYLGAIDGRALDAGLVAALARSRPEWTFVLVGPGTGVGRSPLRGLSNVHIHGPVPYGDAPSVVRGFDVGIIPYRVGGLIDYVHPKKCYEYLAAGRPVVATALPALVALAEAGTPIRVAGGVTGFAAAIDAALAEAGRVELAGRRRSVAEANSWPARGDQLRGLLAGLVAL